MPLTLTRTVAAAFVLAVAASAQAQPSAAVNPSTSVPRVVRLDGQFVPASGLPPAAVEAVTLAIYASQTDETPLWSETQDVRVDAQGRYAVLLGASTAEGIPASVLSGEARWLGIRFARPGEVEQPRVPMTSVPYALRASDADTLGGLPPTAFLRAPNASGATGATTAATTAADRTTPPLVNTGTANYIGKFTNSVDLTSSVLFENASRIGLGTTTPLDFLHTRFTDTTGSFTGLAVQNMGSGAASYSGMLFYDHTGALRQFQGYNNSNGEYRINNIAAGGSINFMTGSVSRFRVAPNGNIGIGTTATPPAALTVNGNIELTLDASRSVTVADQSSNLPGQSLTVRAGSAGIGGLAWNGGDLVLQAGNGFNVDQPASGGDVIIRTGANLTFADPGFSNGGDVVFQTGGINSTFVERMRITETGVVQPGADGTQSLGQVSRRWSAVFATNGTIQTSDARLKTAVADVGYGLREVLQLRPVRFQWKDSGSGRNYLGLIAQEAEQVVPEAVERGEEPGAPLGMSYTSLTPVLIKAIQEQQKTLDARDAEILAIKAENAVLAGRVAVLERAHLTQTSRTSAMEQYPADIAALRLQLAELQKALASVVAAGVQQVGPGNQ